MEAGFPIRHLSRQNLATIAVGAAIAASVFIGLPALVNANTTSPSDKSDLADAQDCEMQNWPYYARACLRDDSKNAGGRATKARIVTTDQLDRARTRAADPDKTKAGAPKAEAPAGWMMSDRDVATYVSAGDFIRRTVR